MKARLFGLIVFILLVLAVIATFRAGYASSTSTVLSTSRCTKSITYTTEIPTQPGRENAYSIPLPDLPGEDIVLACTAFMTLTDGALIHFGYDQQTECQSGYCVAGMEMGKYINSMAFSFWWETPAEAPPVEVVVYLRDCWPGEYCGPQTPTTTPTPVSAATGTPRHDEPESTVTPTEQTLSVWVPFIQKWSVMIGYPPDPRITPEVGR